MKLSPQEYKVVKLIEKGYRNTKVAQMMEINEKTVSTYLRRIYVKIGLNPENNIYFFITELQRLHLLDDRDEDEELDP